MADTQPVYVGNEPARGPEDMDINLGGQPNPYQTMEEEMEARIHQAEAEERLAREMSKIAIEEYNGPQSPMEQTKVIGNIREILSSYTANGALPGKEMIEQFVSGGRAAGNGGKSNLVKPTRKPAGREEVMRRAAEVSLNN